MRVVVRNRKIFADFDCKSATELPIFAERI